MQNNLLKFNIDGTGLAISAFTYAESLDSPCSTFEATLAPSAFPLVKKIIGKSAVISIGDLKRHVIIDAYNYTPGSSLDIAGRDQISLAIDNSSVAANYSQKRDIKIIAKKITEETDINADLSDVHGNVKEWTVSPEDTVFESLDKLLSPKGYYLVSPNGTDLKATKQKDSFKTIDKQTQIVSINMSKNTSEIYGKYICIRKSEPESYYSDSIKQIIKEEITDKNANKSKIKVFSIGSATKDEALERLHVEARTRAERGTSITVNFIGFKRPNLGEKVKIKTLGIDETGVIKGFSYKISNGTNIENMSSWSIGGTI